MAPVLTTPAEQIDTIGEQSMGVQVDALNASSYEAENLPDGFSINTENGKITGTGTAEQTRAVEVTAKGTSGESSATFIWKVIPDVTAISLPDQTSRKNEPIHLKLGVPGAGEYQAEGLPPGLSLNTSTGEITGAPTTFGEYDVTVAVKNEAVANKRGNLIIGWGSKATNSLAGGYVSDFGGVTVPEFMRGLQGAVQIGVGQHQIHALKPDGSVWVGGGGGQGQTGRGGFRIKNLEPRPVLLLENEAEAISPPMALMKNGTIKAWGPNNGQLGIGCAGTGAAKWRAVTVESAQGVTLTGVKMFASGSGNAVFVKTNNTVWRSGQKDQQGTNLYAEHEAEYDGLPEITAVATSFSMTLLLLADGTVRTKGRNVYGSLGTGKEQEEEKAEGKTTQQIIEQLISPPLPEKAIAIALSEWNPYVLLESGKVMSWGRNNRGQVGNGEIGEAAFVPLPAYVTGIEDAIAIAAGGGESSGGLVGTHYALALRANRTITAWGGGEEGQCGDNTTGTKVIPVTVHGGYDRVLQIAAGESTAAALIEEPNPRPKPPIELIPLNKALRVVWRNPEVDRNKIEKWELKYRRVEENPVTGQNESFSGKTITITNTGAPEESREITGFPLSNPSPGEWLHPGNVIEVQVATKYKRAKPTAIINEPTAKHYKFTWNGSELAPNGTPEPGWLVTYRRTETYRSMVVSSAKVYECTKSHKSTASFEAANWKELPGHSQVGIPPFEASKQYKQPTQEGFNEIVGGQEVPWGTGEYVTPELENFKPPNPTFNFPEFLTGTEVEVEVEGSYNDSWRNRAVMAKPLGEAAEVPQEVEPAWLPNGVIKVGETLSIVKVSEWTENPTSITHQWCQRGTGENDPNTPIPGETGTTYKLKAEDIGFQIRLIDKASNAVGEQPRESLSGTTRLVVA